MATQTKQAQRPANGPVGPSAVMTLKLRAETRLAPARRLVVLLPAGGVDEAGLSRRIWALAAPQALEVLFLGLSGAAADEAHTRRRLATLAAMTRDDGVRARGQLVPGADWVAAARAVVGPGDVLVCQAEQRRAGWGWPQPLHRALSAALPVPVQVLSGFCVPAGPVALGPLARIVFWAVAAAIIVGFIFVQGRLSQQLAGGDQTIGLLLSVVVEFSLLATWNHLFR